MYSVELRDSYFPAQEDDSVRDTTLGDILRQRATEAPGDGALVESDINGDVKRRWTYAELLAEVDELASALQTRFSPLDRIAVWAPNAPEWVLLEFASAIAGLTLVTINPANTARELKYVLEQSGSVGLFLVTTYRGNPMWETASKVVSELPSIREMTDIEDRDSLFRMQGSPLASPEIKPGDPAQIQYTSGTTGFPKGALLHHGGLSNNARMVFHRLGASSNDTVLNFMPMFHTSGCGINTLGAMQHGARMIIARIFDPDQILDLIETERATMLFAVPTMLFALLEAQAAKPRDLCSVRMAVSGGSMVPPELVRRVRDVFGCGFETVFGQTETSPVLTQTYADDEIEDLCETIGQPLPQIEMSIRQIEANTVMPTGEIGEICARGYCVMLGYNNNPEATSAAIDDDDWLHTGDLGSMDSRGYLRITGRVKDLIIRGGENLFPAEIENVIVEHPDIAEVAVIGAPDARWGEIVVAFVRLKSGATLDHASLFGHCRQKMSPQKTPAYWVEVDEWPLTGSGKIQKFTLLEGITSGRFQLTASSAR